MSLSVVEDAAAPSSERVTPQRRPLPAAAFWTILALGTVAGLYWAKQVLDAPQLMMHLLDLNVYQVAANRVVDGVSVYDTPLLGNTRGVWEYVYTPFAALLFTPLAALHGELFRYAGAAGNLLMLAGSAWAALSMLGYRRDLRLAVVSLPIAGLLLWCEPVRETVTFGQINILLLVIVLADMALPDSSRWKGVLTGIAAGIKLTPAFFVVYLLVTRRYRAAATAVGAFVATALIGLAIMPKDSLTYWRGAFMDPTRVGVPDNPQNESLRGMVARTVGVGGDHQVLWLVGAITIAAACLILARRLSLTGHELPAVVLCGLTTTAVSPYSWIHHWVWLAPMLIHLTDLAVRRRTTVAPLGCLVAAVVASGGLLALYDPRFSSIINLPARAHLGVFYHNAYVWLTLALFAAAAVYLRRAADRPGTALSTSTAVTTSPAG
ncbi:glycosyltransferase 87 family protein [Nocardia sp. BMG51109]|uniref:glycosyltransferase 87 family protein n=1 Tax=Nocardia sp. BMG51109 TaxID=1056816 RepID=UPI0004B443B9|nr:glycosyltransferase 87 family protein [Nocardia sp. BMG51109]